LPGDERALTGRGVPHRRGPALPTATRHRAGRAHHRRWPEGGAVTINPTGTPWLATAEVATSSALRRAACSQPATADAAALAVYLHGPRPPRASGEHRPSPHSTSRHLRHAWSAAPTPRRTRRAPNGCGATLAPGWHAVCDGRPMDDTARTARADAHIDLTPSATTQRVLADRARNAAVMVRSGGRLWARSDFLPHGRRRRRGELARRTTVVEGIDHVRPDRTPGACLAERARRPVRTACGRNRSSASATWTIDDRDAQRTGLTARLHWKIDTGLAARRSTADWLELSMSHSGGGGSGAFKIVDCGPTSLMPTSHLTIGRRRALPGGGRLCRGPQVRPEVRYRDRGGPHAAGGALRHGETWHRRLWHHPIQRRPTSIFGCGRR
jgi:hypothetical protein